jgi:hypothetical protein
MHPAASAELAPASPAAEDARSSVGIGIAVGALPLALFLVPRPSTGDLHSHVYNAWLASLAKRGELPGIFVVNEWTNVLVDRVLDLLLAAVPVAFAESIVMVLLAEAFIWSAFAFCCSVTRQPCWEWLPILGVLALGWTFQMGFANWYASAALALLASAAALGPFHWKMRASVAIPMLVLAATANPLPVVWSAVVVALVLAIRRWPSRSVPATIVAIAAICGPAAALAEGGRARYHLTQLTTATGADQLHVFGAEYGWFDLALLFLWVTTLASTASRPRRAAVLPVAVFSTACCLLVPDVIWFPGFAAPLSFHAARTSLLSGVAWTAAAACAPPVRWRLGAIGGLAGAWCLLVCADVRAISRVNSEIERAVATLPPASRVVSAVGTPPSRIQVLEHVVDSACVGRCFSWGNYEPASTVFRVRAREGNTFVVSQYSEAMDMVRGTYRAPDLPFPLWKVHPCNLLSDPPRFCVSRVGVGEAVLLECVDPFFRLDGARQDRCAR